jgi:hypothetical protein
MDDKLLGEIDRLLAQMQFVIQEIRSALPIVLSDADKHVKASGVLRQALRTQVSAASRFMSGRWVRRDGDVYGIVSNPMEGTRSARTRPSPTMETRDADSPPGDIRPPDQR